MYGKNVAVYLKKNYPERLTEKLELTLKLSSEKKNRY